MVKCNPNYGKLAAGYLFPEIGRRVKAFTTGNPGVKVMRLGVGDTTQPLEPSIVKAMHAAVDGLSREDTYSGYGDEQGNAALRAAIAAWYGERGVTVEGGEVFVSDGAKCDSANIASIFASDSVVAVQDPAYPVYVDSNVIAGRTASFKDGRYEGLVYLPCTEENGFVPSPPSGKVDLIYLCSPNNPTGAVATREQLAEFVEYARANGAVIIFDAAYSFFITDSSLPRSIYEIPGAAECAIELSSFSKFAGFTGVRLGWSVVPKALKGDGCGDGGLNALWNRRQCTMFNGASNVAQAGGLAALSPEGREECGKTIEYYMENARVIREGLSSLGFKAYGGVNAPFAWVKTPGVGSWEFFDKLLNECRVVCTPGAGFGPCGEGFVRFSAFGRRENVQAAVASIRENLKL
ncbi:MAG: LL-diaminopimelate aminotransferase [Candidatus Micrarchaeota archaeon]